MMIYDENPVNRWRKQNGGCRRTGNPHGGSTAIVESARIHTARRKRIRQPHHGTTQ